MVPMVPAALGRPETMPAKISSEMPLPMPRSVICSPSHITKMEPVARVKAQSSLNADPGDDHHVGSEALGQGGDAEALDEGQADGEVAGPLVDLLRPASPSFFWRFSRVGTTAPINCSTMLAVM
jgi:hypothetical protein